MFEDVYGGLFFRVYGIIVIRVVGRVEQGGRVRLVGEYKLFFSTVYSILLDLVEMFRDRYRSYSSKLRIGINRVSGK